jgi:hypothetical protein
MAADKASGAPWNSGASIRMQPCSARLRVQGLCPADDLRLAGEMQNHVLALHRQLLVAAQDGVQRRRSQGLVVIFPRQARRHRRHPAWVLRHHVVQRRQLVHLVFSQCHNSSPRLLWMPAGAAITMQAKEPGQAVAGRPNRPWEKQGEDL